MTKNSRNFILVALALLPVTAFGTIMLLLFGQAQQKSIQLLLEQTATSTISAVQHSITNDISVLQALANDHALSRGDYVDFDDAARRVLETRPAWLRIILSDRQRHIVNTGVSFGSPMQLIMDIVSSEVNQRRRHLFERRHARRSVVIGRGRICPWLGTLAWSDQAATAP